MIFGYQLFDTLQVVIPVLFITLVAVKVYLYLLSLEYERLLLLRETYDTLVKRAAEGAQGKQGKVQEQIASDIKSALQEARQMMKQAGLLQ
jgi:hypothetical protein